MKINLLSDYQGVLTNEVFYLAGEHDVPDGVAQALIKAGRALSLDAQLAHATEQEAVPKPQTTRTKRTRKPKDK